MKGGNLVNKGLLLGFGFKKRYCCLRIWFRITETLDFTMFADSSTDTKADRNRWKGGRKRKKERIIFQVSGVRCQVSHFTRPRSLTPTAKATDLPPTNSPDMHSRLVCKNPKIQNNIKTQNLFIVGRLKAACILGGEGKLGGEGIPCLGQYLN